MTEHHHSPPAPPPHHTHTHTHRTSAGLGPDNTPHANEEQTTSQKQGPVIFSSSLCLRWSVPLHDLRIQVEQILAPPTMTTVAMATAFTDILFTWHGFKCRQTEAFIVKCPNLLL